MQFAKNFAVHFSKKIQADAKCLVLLENFYPSPGRHVICEMDRMSTLAARGNWNIAKGKLKQKVARLTADETQFIAGKKDELTGRIQKRTAQSRKKPVSIEEEWCDYHPQ